MSTPSQVPMMDSQGNVGMVDPDKVESARATGQYEPAYKMQDSQGNVGWVGESKVASARTQEKPYALMPQPGTVFMLNPQGKPTYAMQGEVNQFLASGHKLLSHPDFYTEVQNGKVGYHYPEGQKALSEDHPEISTDDAGNIYNQGLKIAPHYMTMLPPVLPGGALAKAGSKVAGLFKGGQASQSVATGLVDEAGNAISREVIQQVPSMASKFASDVTAHLVKNGMTYVKAATYASALEELIRRGIKDIFK